MKKAGLFIRAIAWVLTMALCVSMLGGCNLKTVTTTSMVEVPVDEDGNIIEDENGNLVVDEGADEDGDGEPDKATADGDVQNTSQKSSTGGTTDGTRGGSSTEKSTGKPYAAPDGWYNFMKAAYGVKVHYDCKETLSDDKTAINITAAGGPALVSNAFMDPNQTYVIRCKVKPNSDDTLARIIFKGNSEWDHLYLGLNQSVSIYDCTPVGTYDPNFSNQFINIECRSYSSAKKLNWKAGKEYDVIILTKPGYASVWIDGELYIDNLDLNNGMTYEKERDIGSGNLFAKKKFVATETRFINTTNVLGFYCATGTASVTGIRVYYTVKGMDLNYRDDGKDTNYQSTWKQKQFYLSAFTHWGHSDMANDKTLYTLIKNANCNLVHPYAPEDRMKEIAAVCENIGLDYMVDVEGVLNQASMINENSIKRVVGTYANKKHAIGYYIWDEPVIDNMWKVRKLSQMVTKYDKTAATYSCLLPSYSSYTWTTDTNPYNEYVDAFVKKVKPQIVANDFYPFNQFGINVQMKTSQFYRDMGYLRKSAIKNNCEFWQAVAAQWNWETAAVGEMTPERIAIQVNAAIAYGASNVNLFTAQEALGTSLVTSGKVVKGKYYDGIAAQNKKSLNVGRLIFNSKPIELYHSDISESQSQLYFIDAAPNGKPKSSAILSSMSSSSKTAGLIVSVFQTGTKHYVVAVNKDYKESCTATITLKKAMSVSAFDTVNNKMGTASSKTVLEGTIGAGGIAVWQVG